MNKIARMIVQDRLSRGDSARGDRNTGIDHASRDMGGGEGSRTPYTNASIPCATRDCGFYLTILLPK